MMRFSRISRTAAALAALIAVSILTGCATGAVGGVSKWPASASGRPMFYYFGAGS
jgi:hypothetical protein